MINKDWLENPTGKIPKGAMCSVCARYNSRYVVSHALVVRNEKVLMLRRSHDPRRSWWALPGGYLSWDETLEQCVVRELKEETGLQGKVIDLLGVYSDSGRDEDGRQNVAVVYRVEALGEAEKSDEAKEVAWFGFEQLPAEIAFDNRQMIEDYIKKHKSNKA